MKFDETRVTIRERSWLEILDLALRLYAEYWRLLSVTFVLAALPLAVANDLLVVRLMDFQWEEDPYAENVKFIFITSVLVFIQAPMASVFTTMLLGRIMFLQSPDLGSLVKQVFNLSPRWLISQGLLRGSLLSLLFFIGMSANKGDTRMTIFTLLTMLAVYLALLRSVRPFLIEVILLERPRYWSGRSDSLSLYQRMQKLHLVDMGDLIVRFIASGIFAMVLSVVIFQILWFVSWVVEGQTAWGPFLTRFCVPTAMWMTAAFFSVVRFLGYLDRRTRNEGWSVSLQLRAESQRLAQQWS